MKSNELIQFPFFLSLFSVLHTSQPSGVACCGNDPHGPVAFSLCFAKDLTKYQHGPLLRSDSGSGVRAQHSQRLTFLPTA